MRSSKRKLASSSPGATMAIDSNQLLSLCQRIRESMSSLDKSIKMAQLRLATLGYIHVERDLSYRRFCLIELCNLSHLVVQQLDDLHVKLSESSENSIDYQIASQQLTFFTSEWYDNYMVRINEALDMASRQGIDLGQVEEEIASPPTVEQTTTTAGGARTATLPTDMRVRDALLRLRQSMRENERLVASIASNIDYTRTTIEAIYGSLQASKSGLYAGEQNAIAAIDTVRRSNRCQMICYLFLVAFLALASFYFVRWLVF